MAPASCPPDHGKAGPVECLHISHETVARRIGACWICLDNFRSALGCVSNRTCEQLVGKPGAAKLPLHEETSDGPDAGRILSIFDCATEPPVGLSRRNRTPTNGNSIHLNHNADRSPAFNLRKERFLQCGLPFLGSELAQAWGLAPPSHAPAVFRASATIEQ